MSQALPTGTFEWVEDCEKLSGEIVSHTAGTAAGKDYMLEVDVEYPQELYDAHNAYPLALHYRNLLLYLSLDMRLKKVHRALRFDQSPWMEPYFRMNTELCKQATSDFEKDLRCIPLDCVGFLCIAYD